jgi:hypothetical protein
MRWRELQHRRGSWTIWKLGIHWSVASLGLFAFFSVSSAGPHIESQPNRMLQPGDQDYPKINSSPSHTVQFRAVIPGGVSAEFHLIYGVATRQIGSAFSAPRGCRWSQATPFYVDLPLKLERSVDGYRGIFSADYFQSGECGWDLYSLISPMLTTWVSSDKSGPVIIFTRSLHTNSHPYPFLDLATQRIDIWCTRAYRPSAIKIPADRAQPRCTDFINANYDLPEGFSESVPLKKRGEWNIHGTQYLQFLTVEFHDLDGLVASYLESHK